MARTAGYVDDLDTYDEELEASLDVIRSELGVYARIMVMGHSTGGLVAALIGGYITFRLGLSPAEEMDDHKMYYDPKDLWPLMVKAGFMPHAIKCFKHKFGLNTFAVATVSTQESP